MHFFHVIAVFLVLSMLGVELSVSAFVNPNAWWLEPAAQAKMLSPFAAVLGKVMPVWYAVGMASLAAETWLSRHTPEFPVLLAASLVWLGVILATLVWLVPLNNQVVAGAAGWQEIHRTWDSRHRVRIVALALASILLLSAVVR